MTAQAGTTDFTDAGATETMGFNGAFLRPTLRAARGEKVAVNVTNQLAEPTSVHWHGMHLPAAMDGGPHQFRTSNSRPAGSCHCGISATK
ncbi:multicopper oxidase domain-containing protein [Arthrobacter sp. Y81]|uniref:multicopper oxidase domain-containing protein n=1 Tax=Arthrobacter sp. Y81 TaxID=2058897 RepID=UPI0021583215|nr:multicopper oxidase domain-containing protein [Arthrobacter sp. Y81]